MPCAQVDAASGAIQCDNSAASDACMLMNNPLHDVTDIIASGKSSAAWLSS